MPALTGSLAAGTAATYCLRASLSPSVLTAHSNSSLSATLTVTSALGSWAATAVDTATLVVGDTVAPTVPGTPVALSATKSSISLVWAASSDDVGVSGYDVFRDGVLIASVTSARYTDNSTLAKTPYRYTVTARDAAGNVSAPSAALIVTTGNQPTGYQVRYADGTLCVSAPILTDGAALAVAPCEMPVTKKNQAWQFIPNGDGAFTVQPDAGTEPELESRRHRFRHRCAPERTRPWLDRRPGWCNRELPLRVGDQRAVSLGHVRPSGLPARATTVRDRLRATVHTDGRCHDAIRCQHARAIPRQPGLMHYVGVGLSAGLLALMVALAAAVIVIPALVGGVPLTVLTGSMEPTLPPGTLVVVKPTPVQDIRVGNVLTYQIHSGEPAVVSHRVLSRSVSTDGTTTFITKGDNNDSPDAQSGHPGADQGHRLVQRAAAGLRQQRRQRTRTRLGDVPGWPPSCSSTPDTWLSARPCRSGGNAAHRPSSSRRPAPVTAGQLTRSSCQVDSPRLVCREGNKTTYGSNGHPGVARGA